MLVLFLVLISFILFKISSLEISMGFYFIPEEWENSIKQMKHDLCSLTLSQKLEMDGISDTSCSAPKLRAQFLTSIILNSKHETFIGNGKLFSYLHLKVFVYCSLKVLYINGKKILVVPDDFFMFSIQDNLCWKIGFDCY